jgi:hypothetical protein
MKRIYLCLLLCASFLNHAFAQTIWTGATGSNWETPTNWSPNSVPNATDDVIIPNTNNDPIVIAGTEASAKSIWVQIGSSLTIQSTAELSIYGAKALFGSISCALFNEGNVNNSGQLVLHNPAMPSIGGLFNLATFTNSAGGEILIGSFGSNGIGLWNKGSVFANAGILSIGRGEATGLVGIDNGGLFGNNPGGQIFIDRTSSAGLFNNTGGTFTNKAGIIIGELAVGSYGLRNDAIFTNNAGGQIRIDRSTAAGLYNKAGTFTNVAGIVVGASATIGFHGLRNEATFNNNTGGEIKIDRSTSIGLLNNGGTFTNVASIVIGAKASVGSQGLYNSSAFNNGSGGQVHIDNTTFAGLVNSALGTFTNVARIVVGANAAVGSYGLYNPGNFSNGTGGEIRIDNTTFAGLFNGLINSFDVSATFTNAATIVIGANASVDEYGIYNTAAFNNNVGGQIHIDRSTNSGLLNGGVGTFTNEAGIRIGGTVAVGFYGLRNVSTFVNNTGGEIQIDRSTTGGLYNQTTGTFTNAAAIAIGATAAVGNYGLINSKTFTNGTGGDLMIDRSAVTGLYNLQAGLFVNEASIVIGALAPVGSTGLHNNGTFSNDGCKALLKVSSDAVINDNNNGVSNSGNIIEYGSGASNIATNTGLVQNLNGGTFNITNNTGILTASVGTLWRGCTNTSWNTASNWSGNAVPTADDDVIIPNVINDPEISASAVAHSIEVLSDAALTIQSTGSLTINGGKNFSVELSTAVYNLGTINNSGRLIIGNLVTVGNTGLFNAAIFNNNTGAEITIDRSTIYGLTNASGTFTNASKIIIGATAAVGNAGLYNVAQFNNLAGAEIMIDRSAVFGLWNYYGTITNAGNITIGSAAAMGSTGLRNDATFNNSNCASLTLMAALFNSSSFTNQGLFTVNTTQPHQNTGFTNQGILSYPQGNAIPNVTNNTLIVAPISVCGYDISSALQIGTNNTFTIDGTWYQDAALTNGAATYSNNTFWSVTLDVGSTYPLYFKVTDPVNGCSYVVSISVTLKAAPTLGLIVTSPNVTTGQSVTLTAIGAATYLWSTGATSNQIIVVPPTGTTIYSVIGTASSGCTATLSTPITATDASLSVSSPAKLCVKSTPPTNTVVTLPVTMQVSGGLAPYTYNWSYKAPNSTSYKPIAAKGTTIGKVTFSPVAGTATLKLTGTKGNLNGLQGYKIRLTVMSNSQTSSAETLLDGSCLLGTTSSSITMNANNGNLNEIEAESRTHVQVYPNPVVDVLQVTIRGLQKKALVNLVDMQGRSVRRLQITPVDGLNQLRVPVTGLAGGLYTLQVVTADGLLHQQKVLKVH